MNQLKRFLYFTWQILLKIIWRLSGGRREKAMGIALNLHPDTVWPGRRGLKFPNEDCRSKMVAYADFVQAHAACYAISTLQKQPVIIDVGAHHGEYAVLLGGLLKARGGGILIAIEPDIINVKILKSNIICNNLHDVVYVVEGAVSDFTGERDFISNGSEGHLFAEDHTGKSLLSKIKVETLCDILTRFKLNKVDILLVDVEGAELSVLRGFPWEIMKPAMIFCELHPYNWAMFGYTGQDFSNFLKEHQYRCLDMYLQEHNHFDDSSYIGPCLFLPKESTANVEA